MDIRLLLHRLCIVTAIVMVVAALTYRGEALSQAAARPPVLESKQAMKNENDDRAVDKKLHEPRQSFSPQELAERSARLLQQRRVARLQLRL